MTDTRARKAMIETNAIQKAYYEDVREHSSFSKGGKKSLATRVWAGVRSRIWAYQRDLGLRETAMDMFQPYFADIESKRVLDLGCGSGSKFTMWLAEHAGEYVGLDLAEYPVSQLNKEFSQRGFERARGVAGDFLDNDFPDHHFDVIYAYAVLHHFEHVDVLVAELDRQLKPGGVILSYDPMKTEPLNRLARAIYRPWQSDRAWEWPFSEQTIETLGSRFTIEQRLGLLGMSKLGLPFYLVPGLQGLGKRLASWGSRFDATRAVKPGWAFRNCWQVALVMRKTS